MDPASPNYIPESDYNRPDYDSTLDPQSPDFIPPRDPTDGRGGETEEAEDATGGDVEDFDFDNFDWSSILNGGEVIGGRRRQLGSSSGSQSCKKSDDDCCRSSDSDCIIIDPNDGLSPMYPFPLPQGVCAPLRLETGLPLDCNLDGRCSRDEVTLTATP